MKISIINGPNLNMLGYRDVKVYGKLTYEQLLHKLKDKYSKVEFFQSNHEGDIIDELQRIKKNENEYIGVVLNLGGYTHTSIAIADAVGMLDILKVEVHLSDITKREQFRKISYISDIVNQRYYGEYELSYIKAIDYILGGK